MTRIKKTKSLSTFPTRIALVVSDFDGVMTDNRVIVNQDGTESVVCNRSDGWGIALLKENGIPIVVLSTERSPVVQARCDKLSIPCYQNSKDKLATLKAVAEEYGAALKDIIFVGNDTNDLECIRSVGCGVAVTDAHPEVRRHARFVLSSRGGEGAIRELCELVLEKLSRSKRPSPVSHAQKSRTTI